MFNSKILTDNGVNLEKSLELFGDMNTYNESLNDFLNDVENKMANIKKYKENGDMANYAILVHSLKSDSKYFGFEKLADIAFNHEKESKANNMYYVSLHYDELEEEAKRIIDIVKTYLGVNNLTMLSGTNEKVKVKKNNTILVVDDSNINQHDWKDKIHIYKDSGYDCRYRAHSEQSRLDKHPEHILSGLSKHVAQQTLSQNRGVKPVCLYHYIDEDAEYDLNRIHMPEDADRNTDDTSVLQKL